MQRYRADVYGERLCCGKVTDSSDKTIPTTKVLHLLPSPCAHGLAPAPHWHSNPSG